jgi:hypothetical protein
MKTINAQYAPPARQNKDKNTPPDTSGRTSCQRTRRKKRKQTQTTQIPESKGLEETKLHSQDD